jgi:hypothetical protein
MSEVQINGKFCKSDSLPPCLWGWDVCVSAFLSALLSICLSTYIPHLQLESFFFLLACFSMICREEENLEHPAVSGDGYSTPLDCD